MDSWVHSDSLGVNKKFKILEKNRFQNICVNRNEDCNQILGILFAISRFFFAIDFDRLLWELKNRTKWANRGFFKNKSAESKFEDCYLARPYLGRALKKFITFYEIKDGWEVKSVIIKVRKNNTTEIMKIYKDKNKNIRLNVQEDWSGEFK